MPMILSYSMNRQHDRTRYDQHAIRQIDRNIEPFKYKLSAKNLPLPEVINSQKASIKTVRTHKGTDIRGDK